MCEQCGRKTDYLFKGEVVTKATRYSHGPRPKPIGVVDVHRDAMVCLPCRPLSNLEIAELLEGREHGPRQNGRVQEDIAAHA